MSASTESSTSEISQSTSPALDTFIDLIVNRRGTTNEPIRRQGFVAFNRLAAQMSQMLKVSPAPRQRVA